MQPLLSILIPSIPSRIHKLEQLITSIPIDPRVEMIVLMDNKKRFLGPKRNLMMDMAQGKYLAHIDDDEMLSADYSERVLPELEHGVDLVAYDAGVSFNNSPEFKVTTMLGATNEQPKILNDGKYSDIIRTPWHWCAWRADFARQFKFPEGYRGDEDWGWLSQALPKVQTWRKIDWIGFHHRWSAEQTEFKE